MNNHLLNAILLAGAALFLAACGGHSSKQNSAATGLPVIQVSAGTIVEADYTMVHHLPGTVHPAERASIAARLQATVASVEVSIGQKVSKDEVLITLDAVEISARAEQAEAALAELTRNYTREKGLLAQKATTEETVRTLEDRIRQAEARLREVRTLESYTRIMAPFDGVVTEKFVRRGDLASPGMPLLTLEGKASMEVHVQVPDSLSTVKAGQDIPLMADDEPIVGRLSEWSPAANPHSRTRLAKLSLPEEALVRSGQFVRVQWPAATRKGLWLPASARRLNGQLEQVFVIHEGKAHLRIVRTGPEDAMGYRILAGLKAGDSVVLNPPAELRDQQPVKVKS
jgi:RND family efflux transporter MFP subunit